MLRKPTAGSGSEMADSRPGVTPTVLVVGCGVVGTRVARHLAEASVGAGIVVDDPQSLYLDGLAASNGRVTALGNRSWETLAPDVVVLALPAGHVDSATRALRAGAHVVSVSDDAEDVHGLFALGPMAASLGRRVVVGAGYAPGLTCVLARHGASMFDEVDEIHVAKIGTAGPACARQHHAALSGESLDWRDGRWEKFVGGSGRELCWFPGPIGGVDCYRAALVDPMLLQPVFPDARRITARVGATRRDRATARLPMLRRPHAEAGDGAVRVEVRGRRDGRVDSIVLGSAARTSVGTAAVAAFAVAEVLSGRCVGAPVAGLGAQVADPVAALHALRALGVSCATFEGAAVGSQEPRRRAAEAV